MIRVFLLVSLLFLGVGFQARAQDVIEEPHYDEAREQEVAQKAKKRLYPGGRDEEDLKVQSQLTTPVRKLSPQAEIKEEPAEE